MQVTLASLLADLRNLSYFFYGFAVIWVIVIGCIFALWRNEQALRNEIEELKQTGAVAERETKDA
ncbi:MAG: hypothetical protein KGJ80_00005 [Chloroflexota bacterium]|nr:hypothetical protein [Chloroflexota bacterium]